MKEEFQTGIGRRIYALRDEQRLSQEALAEKAETSKQTISIVENGKREMLVSNAVKIADALGVSTDYLLKGVRTDIDYKLLDERIRSLTDEQYQFIAGVIVNFIDLCQKTI